MRDILLHDVRYIELRVWLKPEGLSAVQLNFMLGPGRFSVIARLGPAIPIRDVIRMPF